MTIRAGPPGTGQIGEFMPTAAAIRSLPPAANAITPPPMAPPVAAPVVVPSGAFVFFSVASSLVAF